MFVLITDLMKMKQITLYDLLGLEIMIKHFFSILHPFCPHNERQGQNLHDIRKHCPHDEMSYQKTSTSLLINHSV